MKQAQQTFSLREIESKLIGIWSNIFNKNGIDVNSDFFELGGNSLTAVKFLHRVEQEFGVDSLLPDVLFTNGVLKRLAVEIENYINSNQPVKV